MDKVKANLKLSIKSLMQNKLILVLFVLCQILGFFSLLFSTSLMLHIWSVQFEQSVFTINSQGQMTYGECVAKLENVDCDSMQISLSESNNIFVSYGDSPYLPNLGREINDNEYEAIIGDIEGRPQIGEYFEYGDKEYKVVGYIYKTNYIELSPKGIDEQTLVYDVVIFKNVVYQNQIDKFADTLADTFNCEPTKPNSVDFATLITGSPLILLVLGIIGISFVTMLLCYNFMFLKRRYNFMVLRLIGAKRKTLIVSLILEVLLMVGATMAVASLLFVAIERIFLVKAIKMLFGNAFYLQFEYYIYIFLIFAIFCMLSALPAILKSVKKRLVG